MFVVFCGRELPGVKTNDDTESVLLLIDTAGCNLSELEVADNESKGNEGPLIYIYYCIA